MPDGDLPQSASSIHAFRADDAKQLLVSSEKFRELMDAAMDRQLALAVPRWKVRDLLGIPEEVPVHDPVLLEQWLAQD